MLHTLHFKLWRCVHQSRQRLLNRVLVCLQLGSHFLTWWILTTGQCDSHWRFPAVFRWRSPSTSWKSEQWTPIQNTRWCAYVFFFFLLLLESSQRYEVSFSINCRVRVQVVIDTDKTTYSLRLQTQDQLDHMVNHINYALSRVFNNSIYA